MDDLIPFLVFIVIALINFAKFLMERGAKEKRTPAEAQEQPQQRRSSSLEDLFEGLARKLDPNEKPVDLPEWPDGYDKPDYTAEQAAYEEYQQEHDEIPTTASEEIITMPEPVNIEPVIELNAVQVTSLKSSKTAMPAMKSSFISAAIPSMPMMKNNAAGSINFSLKNPAELRKAILAKVVLDPPRAFDASFENTAQR
ncbi:hypothetical protein [Pontiella agarivorans]|uniref:Uncharacterized protein n=1 Tax=Pontiella agarivorans TaxID=3038953 RepID=A0ABU5MXA8_9BACT|nr:hypothetical protein [Pontiella agarivorans]MDZ8118851.1 hypothetical protein [Pontiella agarivorans]